MYYVKKVLDFMIFICQIFVGKVLKNKGTYFQYKYAIYVAILRHHT